MAFRIATLSISLLFHLAVAAQTPVANRIKAVVKTLPADARVIAKYTDNHRHCLYFAREHRVYCYDVLTGKTEDVNFSASSYTHILSAWLSPDGNFFFVAVDKSNLSPFYLDSGQELWRYDSRTRRTYKVGQGYQIQKRKGCIVIKRASRCLTPNLPQPQQRWMGQEHYYDLYGKVIWAKDEFEIKLD